MSYRAPPSILAHVIVFGIGVAIVLTPFIAITALIIAVAR